MIPVSYNARSLIVRWKTTLMSVSGFALVVASLVVMLACVKGVRTVCVASGDPKNVLVLNRGNNDEALNRMTYDVVAQVENTEGIARDDSGKPLASRELFMLVQPFSEAVGGYVFLQVRGVTDIAFRVHSQVKLSAGRQFDPGRGEVIIGRAIQRSKNLKLGDPLEIGERTWTVVGIFEADAASFESEIWCDLSEVASLLRLEGMYSSVVLRAQNETAAQTMVQQLTDSPKFSVKAVVEPEYYAEQSEQMAFIELAVLIMGAVMGIGSVFAIMNTMFASISQRARDIALLRLLGYESHQILIAFLAEAVFVALIGGIAGVGLGYLTNGFSQSVTIGQHELAFAFRVDQSVVVIATVFTLLMGVVGGLLPAVSAMRIKPIVALR